MFISYHIISSSTVVYLVVLRVCMALNTSVCKFVVEAVRNRIPRYAVADYVLASVQATLIFTN